MLCRRKLVPSYVNGSLFLYNVLRKIWLRRKIQLSVKTKQIAYWILANEEVCANI